MSKQQGSGGWLDRGLQERDQKVAEKVSKKPATTPVAKPTAQQNAKPEGKRMSMRDKILAATKEIDSASELRNVLQDAKECQASQILVDRFVKLIREINDLAIYILGSEMSEREAQSTWESMSWEERENQLVHWAQEGNEEARKRMEKLPEFYEDADGKENLPTKLFLHEIVNRFVDPLRWINTMFGLKKFLDDLANVDPPKTPMVKVIYNPRFNAKDDGIEIESGRDKLLYLPKPGVMKIARVWPYIKEVEARARQSESKINALHAKATPEFTPVKISRGEEGSLFLSLSGKEAVLMQAKRQTNDEMTVQIMDSVGIPGDQLPDEAQLWDKKLHRPASIAGKWIRVCRALDEWKIQREESSRAQKQARNSLLAPLTDITNISNRFEDQGLTKILKGEIGVVSFWRDNFWNGKKKGFFGIALEHQGNGTYVLKAAVSDPCFRFPTKELVGETLPLEVDHNEPSFRLKQTERMKSERWEGVRMVIRLLEIRLEQESRFADSEQEKSDIGNVASNN